MTEVLRQDVDFHGLFKKLGHHLEEIRVRALENILSKLEHKLVCDSDLVQERHLFIRLLEWFNFPRSTRHSDVLNLLLRLSQHTAAAEILQEVGGVEFLTHLRKDVSPALQPLLDQILENTMRLPDVRETVHAPECIYQKHEHTGMTTGLENTMASVISRHTAEHTVSMGGHSRPPTEPGHIPDYREPPLGYFEGQPVAMEPPPTSQLPPAEAQIDAAGCFRMTVFPWLALTPTDRHVIVSTNTSLQSRETSLLVSTCDFLSDVVFQDFPAEIFLQRPNIIKNLISLVSNASLDSVQPQVHAIRALADFASCLLTKIRCQQDPSLYTPKQDFSSTPSAFSTPSSTPSDNAADPRPAVIGWTDTRHRGDGRDGDTSGSSSRSSHNSSVGLSPGLEREEMDFEDMPSLQFIQVTVPQFCVAILDKALPLLKTSDETLVTETFHLLHNTLYILAAVVTPDLWEDGSMAAREIVDKLSESLDVIASLLKFHHHSNMPYENTQDENFHHSPADLIQHRLAYVGTSLFLGNFLTSLVVMEKCLGIIPESLVSAMGMLVFDEALSDSHPDLQVTLLGYLQQLDQEKYSTYVSTATVCQSMQKTCRLMMLCGEEASRLSQEVVGLCEAALPSLPYHGYLPYITETIKLCSDVCTKSQHFGELQSRYRTLVMKFLSHPNTRFRHHSYSTVLSTVQTSLSVAKAAEPGNTSSEKAKFLIHSDVLYEIIVFGLADPDHRVSSLATDLLSHLLKSRLLMSPDMWNTLMSVLLRGLPVLQSYAGLNTVLGNTIISLLETRKSTSPGELPLMEKLRGTLRCMLSSDLKVRSEALKRLAWFLSNEENSARKLPVFSELDVTNLSNIFIVDTPRSVDEDLGKSVFQVDGLRKVYEIFTSLSVDPGVKKSAADQLAIILQDATLHAAFRKDGGLEKTLEHIQLAVLRDGDSHTNNYLPYIPACVTILRNLVHNDYNLRHKLAHDAGVYHTLVRAALLHLKDERTCYEVAHTLTLLLFDEQARFFMGGTKNTTFSVPLVVKSRYRLPFRPATHYDTSPHKVAAPPEPDALQSGLPCEMLRMTWNVAWHNGMEQLLSFITQQKSQQESFIEFSPKLKLTPTDKVLLTTSHKKQGLLQGINGIANATSHTAVGKALTRLLSHLVVRYDVSTTAVFHTLDWCSALGRFVKVTPSSSADETLLLDILKFISLVLKLTNQVPDNILQWIGEVLYHPKGPLIGLLHRPSAREAPEDVSEPLVNIKRSLDKALLRFIATYNSSLPYILCTRLKFHQLRGDLVHKLLLRLNVTDAPHFYNLASLEGTLQCLMHITARPSWSQECTEQESGPLCLQVLSCLLEVVSAFHIGRGGSSMSFMGKGVTKAATLCLRHLIFEMATQSTDKDWCTHWLYSRHGADLAEEPGLDWLLTLWAYRDSEVRTAGLGIAVALTSTEQGRLLMTSNCKHIPGGIWGAAFSILLDQSECSMVRQQAALILVNLTSQSMPSGTSDMEQTTWQGPIVTDTEYQVSLVGLTALLALLHHSQFYREMMMVLSSYYPQPSIQPTVVSDVYQASGPSSNNTTALLAEAGIAPRPGNQSASQQLMSVSQVIFAQQRQPKLTSAKTFAFTSAASGRGSQRLGAIGAIGEPQVQRTPSNTASSSNMTTPTAADAGQTREGDSSGEDQQGGITEYQSVTTPCLVSAVSQLVRNLVVLAPQDTVTSLKNEALIPFFVSMIDANFLEGIQVLTTTDQLELFFTELVQMHINILRLLQACLLHDASTRIEILQDKVALGGIVSLLQIFSDASEDTATMCRELWETVLSFLTILIQLQTGPGAEVLTQVLHRQWVPVSERLQGILEDNHGDQKSLYLQCLHFLSVLLREEGKLQPKHTADNPAVTMTTLLNTPLQPESEDKDQGQVTAGSRFCKALVSTYDQWILRKTESQSEDKVHVITTLKCLLALSQSAKATALEMGLVENLMEHVKQTHAKLNMASLQVGKTSGKGKEEPIIQELVVTFDLLRNFMYQAEDIKMACYHGCLHGILHKLWAWCMTDTNLLSHVLSLLTTYTASCPAATSSLAFTSATGSVTSATGNKSQLSPNSLVHCFIKCLAKDNLKESITRSLFGLLATLALSSECRNIIWKSNFLREFSEMNPKKSKKSRSKQSTECLWLDLLVNLSFSTEGQQMILKIPDCVDILLEFIECQQQKQQECSAIIVRNLCCHSSNKPKLLANERLIPCLLGCVNGKAEKLRAIGASGLWALVYNNQKAKVLMKNKNVLPQLQDSLYQLENRASSPALVKCTTDIQAVIATVAE